MFETASILSGKHLWLGQQDPQLQANKQHPKTSSMPPRPLVALMRREWRCETWRIVRSEDEGVNFLVTECTYLILSHPDLDNFGQVEHIFEKLFQGSNLPRCGCKPPEQTFLKHQCVFFLYGSSLLLHTDPIDMKTPRDATNQTVARIVHFHD